MSTVTNAIPASSTANRARFQTDSLAVGMVIMLLMTVIGRSIGFVRGIAFCRFMDDVDVGRWSMAFGFITLITPVMLLGIPGAMPRFTEHFRLRGDLNRFIKLILWGTTICTGVFVGLMMLHPGWFAYLIFLETGSGPAAISNTTPQVDLTVTAIAVSVIGMIAFNFVSDLCASLRQVRVVSIMQFVQGVSFTLLSVGWLLMAGAFVGVVFAFAAACVIACLPGGLILARRWTAACHDEEVTSEPSSTLTSMIRRLAPYAAAVWMMNLIGNCFELSDRYMILHFMPGDESIRQIIGQAAVGQYHSGRIIPMLLLSLGTLVAGIMMPYLAADFEAQRHDRVQSRVRDSLLTASILFTAVGAVALLVAPWLFTNLLQDRYTEGLSVMPFALCFCTWSALVTIGQNYLWTVEKGKWVSVAMTVGLGTNFGLNALWLPTFGLQGAVLATLVSHGVVMIGVWTAMVCCGYQLDRWLLATTLLPLSLIWSPLAGLLGILIIMGCAYRDRALMSRFWECVTSHSITRRLSGITVT
ncbi:MAG: lipopolysaccharide biosynthesis protein [Planctomycetota bacterium]